MPRLLILWHSRTGGSEAMASAAAAAAVEAEVLLVRAQDAMPADLLAADGYLFVGPENLASLSGAMKEFFDRCYYPLLGRIEGRPYAHLICAGSDGEGAARQLARIVTGWRLKMVAEPLIIVTGAQSADTIAANKHIAPEDLTLCAERGALLAAGLAMGVF